MQMVHDGIRMSCLRFSATDISFQFFECSLNLPPGTIVFNYLHNGKGQVRSKKCDPLRLSIDPHDPDRAFERSEHHYLVMGDNGPDAAVKIDAVRALKI